MNREAFKTICRSIYPCCYFKKYEAKLAEKAKKEAEREAKNVPIQQLFMRE